MILCDTNILIEFYKNNQNIIAELEKIGSTNIALSVITAGELLFGALNKKETQIIKKDIEHLILMNLNDSISKKFIELMLKYTKSHALAVPDALIAATALVSNVKLYTLNVKDFQFIDELVLYK
ncbi:MAG: type II toxin-antitoxin system VapC family toxin [Sphingobacteriales bacterium]|nr:type II toxin-antitoxin system VapC family toxin [Sphingobacteriales bacterium]